MKITTLLPLAFLLPLLATSCKSSGSKEEAPPPPPVIEVPLVNIAGTSWTCMWIEGSDVQGAAPTLEVEASGKASGFGGVNRWFGGMVDEGAKTVSFERVGMTRMAGPGPQMAQEQRYTRALGRATGWQGTNLKLELVANGEVVLVFIPKT